jgi:hypothetical protein
VQQVIYKLKMVKCSWNVIKLNNSCNVWGWKIKDKIFSCVFEGYILNKYGFYDVISSNFMVDANYGGSILVEITPPTSPYKIL